MSDLSKIDEKVTLKKMSINKVLRIFFIFENFNIYDSSFIIHAALAWHRSSHSIRLFFSLRSGRASEINIENKRNQWLVSKTEYHGKILRLRNLERIKQFEKKMKDFVRVFRLIVKELGEDKRMLKKNDITIIRI